MIPHIGKHSPSMKKLLSQNHFVESIKGLVIYGQQKTQQRYKLLDFENPITRKSRIVIRIYVNDFMPSLQYVTLILKIARIHENKKYHNQLGPKICAGLLTVPPYTIHEPAKSDNKQPIP